MLLSTLRSALRALLAVAGLSAITLAIIFASYFLAPNQNAELQTVDTLIVLGCPPQPDGSPTAEQRERVLEAVRELRRGVSNRVIFSGGAAHNRFVEAHSMALIAEAHGVAASAIIEEKQSRNTLQNIYYSEKIMEAKGWRTTEIISSPYHLPRAAFILSRYPLLKWKTHPAEWPLGFTLRRKLFLNSKEAVGSFVLHIQGFFQSYSPS